MEKVASKSSKSIFDCVVPSGTTYADCHSANVIYLITCSRCSSQYLRETVQKLKKRFNWHITSFNQCSKHGFYCILSDHYHKGLYRNDTYSVQTLET